MILSLFLLVSSLDQASDGQVKVGQALTLLNNQIEAIAFSDACLGRSDSQALRPLEDRIEAARRRAVAAYPTLTGTERAGDVDFICNRASQPEHPSRRVIGRQVGKLLADLEAVLPLERTHVR